MKVKRKNKTPKHNYLKKIKIILKDKYKEFVENPELYDMAVKHDNWCGYFSKKTCNCDPMVKIRRRK